MVLDTGNTSFAVSRKALGYFDTFSQTASELLSKEFPTLATQFKKSKLREAILIPRQLAEGWSKTRGKVSSPYKFWRKPQNHFMSSLQAMLNQLSSGDLQKLILFH